MIRYQNTADENDFIDEIVSFDTSVTITGNSFIRTGYTFSGWIDEEENIYQPGDSGKNFVDSGMFILKTIWQANEYTVKFLAGEGTGTMEDQTFVWDTEAKLHANTFTKNGYNFKHWIAENGQTYSNLSSVKNLIDSGTISLLAQWEAIPVQRSS
ncbi:InlB B-repeat-containing protein [bacterium]|nr:InlB B-repeat-containing protein [bacterium]